MAITPVKELVRLAKEQIETISAQQAQVIPGAFHAPRGMLEFWFDPDSPYHKPALVTDKKLVLFCASAWRSALSVKALQEMGVENIAELEGGFSAWRKSERPVDV